MSSEEVAMKSKLWGKKDNSDADAKAWADYKAKLKKEKKMWVDGGYMPSASIPAPPPFRQNMKMMGHGGQVSVSNDKAGAGDVHTTHSHSGYKAGE